jgi:prolyl-tRNA synthetase
MIMGSFGIGVSRLLSAILEQFARINVEKTFKGDYKFSWSMNFPKALAPFDVHVIPVNVKDDIAMNLSAEIVDILTQKGLQVLEDDRNERAGVKFADSDLIGLPVRVTVGKKASDRIVELKIRATGDTLEVNVDDLAETLAILNH